MKFYTIWKKEKGKADATLLTDEPAFRTKRNAFKRAWKLADKLVYGSGDTILVRKITLGSDTCIEWVFDATA